jgi:hypothetical protein
MKIVFLLAVLLGFGGALAGAHFAPGLGHDRLPSHTAVVANGGRAEQFVIRLPADRIAATDAEAGGLRARGAGGTMQLPAQFLGEQLLVEHFKLRDATGSVIGVAARHWTATAGAGAAATWSILIPSRGVLVLRAPGEARGALDAALRARGFKAGAAWSGRLAVPMVREGDGVVAAGTGEFEGLVGGYTETWTIAAVDEDGRLSGTIEIGTVTSRPGAP